MAALVNNGKGVEVIIYYESIIYILFYSNQQCLKISGMNLETPSIQVFIYTVQFYLDLPNTYTQK